MGWMGGEKQGLKESILETGAILAVVFGFTTLVLLAAGAPPLTAFYLLYTGSLGTWLKVAQVLTGWVPLTLCVCGLVYSFRIGLWNIGVEGQVVAGAVAATYVLRLGAESGSPAMVLVLSFLGGFLGGGLWAVVAGFLKIKGGVNEIFGGLGMNFVAQGITLWLIFGPWKRPGVASMSGTELFEPQFWLSTIAVLRLSPAGLAVTGAVLAGSAWVLGKTRLGLALKAIGSNPKAAYLHGLKPERYIMIAMGLAGGCAGLAGTFQVTGVYHRLIPAVSSNYGYLALLVTMLADYRLSVAPAVAFFFVCLNVGAVQLPMVLQLDSSLSGIIQGALVLAALLVYGWRRRKSILET